MFTCQECGITTLPKTPMIKTVVETEVAQHVVPDGNTLRIVGSGAQIVREKALCPPCAKVDYKPVPAPNYKPYQFTAHAHYHHLGVGKPEKEKCKGFKILKFRDGEQEIIPCKSCTEIVQSWLTFPLVALSQVTQNQQTPPVTVSLAAAAIENLITRTTHTSERAKREVMATMALFKAYEERGGKL